MIVLPCIQIISTTENYLAVFIMGGIMFKFKDFNTSFKEALATILTKKIKALK
jgi:hypothetical protein